MAQLGDIDALKEKINKANEDLKNYKENFKFETVDEVTKNDVPVLDMFDANTLNNLVDSFSMTNKLLSDDIIKFNTDIDTYNKSIDLAEKMNQKASTQYKDDSDMTEALKMANYSIKFTKDIVSFLTSIVAQETKILNKNTKGITYIEREVDKYLAS
jgi:hypothetical protein